MTVHSRSKRHGFSLLELSIVLGIISLIAGAGMSMATGALKAADRITTQERLNTIKLALDSYAKTYGYLPCPANRTFNTSNVDFGVEARTNGTSSCVAAVPGVINNNNTWYGALPVRTLGLPDNYAADAWGNKLSYAVAAFLKNDPTSYSVNAGTINMRYGTIASPYNISSQRTTIAFTSVANNGGGLARVTVGSTGSLAASTIVYMAGTVYKGSYSISNLTATTFDLLDSTFSATDTGNVEFLEPGTNVAYTVVSHGPDGRGAYPLNLAAIPSNKRCNDNAGANTSPAPCTSSATMTCIDIENCDDDNIFFDTAYSDGSQAALYFDDYVVWGSNALARAPVSTTLYPSCSGTCETWCATCGTNYPGGGATAPPASITSGAVLYKKVITSDSTTCSAACFWGGVTASGYVKAP